MMQLPEVPVQPGQNPSQKNPESKHDQKQRELSEMEKMQANIKRWQKEQERIEKVNKELGRIDKNLAILGESPKERKWITVEAEQTPAQASVTEPTAEKKDEKKPVNKTVYICVPCKRKFNSLVGLQVHMDKSEMHMVLCMARY